MLLIWGCAGWRLCWLTEPAQSPKWARRLTCGLPGLGSGLAGFGARLALRGLARVPSPCSTAGRRPGPAVLPRRHHPRSHEQALVPGWVILRGRGMGTGPLAHLGGVEAGEVLLSQLYVLARPKSDSPSRSRDCLARLYGNAGDWSGRVRSHPCGLTDAEWAAVRDQLPVPAWMNGKGEQPEGYCHRQTIDAIRHLVRGLHRLAGGAGRLSRLGPGLRLLPALA